MRDGQHEHVADKGGGAVKDFVCSLYSTACLPAVESALRVPFLLCFLLCPAAIKTDRKMASKALPAKKKRTSSSSYATLAAYVKCVFGLFSILITDP